MILSSGNMKAVQSAIPDYVEASTDFINGLIAEDRTQPGDPQKAVGIILDLVRQEGCAAGRDIPLRFPLGTDCFDTIKQKCEETLKLLEEWKPIIKSTEYLEAS